MRLVRLLLLLLGSTGVRGACSNVTRTASGRVDITRSLYDCSRSIVDPLLIASYFDNIPNITVRAQLGMNNLKSINELKASAHLDIFFRLNWVDERWDFPELFAAADPQLSTSGIEIKDLMSSNEPLQVWTPNDFTFINILEEKLHAQEVKLAPGGQFFWSRHLDLELSQSTLDYHSYPNDKQEILLQFESYGLTANFLQLAMADPPLTFNENGKGDVTITQNPMWNFDTSDYTADIFTTIYVQDINGITVSKIYQNAIVGLQVERVSNGIVSRLALPVLLLLLIGSLIFWSAKSKRIEVTMTLLLAVSALYIVVFSSVPLLGYLTAFDKYFMGCFLLLASCVGVHCLISSLYSKKEENPLNLVCVRFFEILGRLFTAPAVFFFFFYSFGVDALSRTGFGVLVSLLITYGCIVLFIELKSFARTLRTVFGMIGDKKALTYWEECFMGLLSNIGFGEHASRLSHDVELSIVKNPVKNLE